MRITSRGRRAAAAITLLGVLYASGLALAAGTAGYRGRTREGGIVSFRLAGRTVRRFQASVTVTCISAAPARSGTQIYAVAPVKPATLDGAGRFTLTVNAPKEQHKDQTGKIIATLYAVRATVRGRVAGRSATGTVKVTYNVFWMAYNPATGFYQLTVAACFSGKTPTSWTARRQ